MPFMDRCCPARECANPSAKSDFLKQDDYEVLRYFHKYVNN